MIIETFLREVDETWFSFEPIHSGKLFSTYRRYRGRYVTIGPFEDFEFDMISLKRPCAYDPLSDSKTSVATVKKDLASEYSIEEILTTCYFPNIVTFSCDLDTKEGLKKFIEIECKAVLYKYERDGCLDNLYKDPLSSVLIQNIMKRSFNLK